MELEKESTILSFERGYEIKIQKLAREIDVVLGTIKELRKSKSDVINDATIGGFDREIAERISLKFIELHEKLNGLVEELASVSEAWDSYRKSNN